MAHADEVKREPVSEGQTRRRLRPLIWAGRVVGGLLLIILVLLLTTFGLAQTELGKRQLAQLIAHFATTPTQIVELEGIHGFVPFDMRVDRIAIADPQGRWLTIEGAHLAWAPLQLLRGRLVLDELAAERLTLPRAPETGQATPPDRPLQLPQLPELPKSLPSVTVERLAVRHLDLGAPILGEPASFELSGHLGTGPAGRTASAELALTRIDERTADLRVQLALDLDAQTLALHVNGSERGGLLRSVTRQPAAGNLKLAFNGEGPLKEWNGAFSLQAENFGNGRAILALGAGRLAKCDRGR